MPAFQTEFEFTLPLGYADQDGGLHRDGVMRRATAADEILPLRDPRVEQNAAYLVVILLSRVVTRLGSLAQITPKTIEGLYATDLAFLQDLYNRINAPEPERIGSTCPECHHDFTVEVDGLGGFGATPSTGSTRRWPTSPTTSTGPSTKSSPSNTPIGADGRRRSPVSTSD
jgi:hypothetical protein